MPRFFLFLFGLVVLATSRVSASTSTTVVGTAQVNICGNGIVETPAEDCEASDLNGASCTSLGYASGTLSCDISCSFDESACIPIPPSPTPTPSPISTPSAPPVATATPGSAPAGSSPVVTASTQATSNVLEVIPTVVAKVLESFSTPHDARRLPISLRTFLTESGVSGSTITQTNLITLVEYFLKIKANSTSGCDLNASGLCDSVDLSIILYYVKE